MRLATSGEMRELEALTVRAGTTYTALMETAGMTVARFIREHFLHITSCVVLCGKGNNGGDGFVIARLLCRDVPEVTVILLQGEPVTEDARLYFGCLRKEKVTVVNSIEDKLTIARLIGKADLIIDAVYGIGFRGKLSKPVGEVIHMANESKGKRLAVDLPSGVECDTACADENSFQSDETVTFGFMKPCHVSFPAKEYCGRVTVQDIGIPQSAAKAVESTVFLTDDSMVPFILPPRRQNSNKGDFGRLLCVCGSSRMSGAAVLSLKGALRCGAGLVTAATVKSLLPPLMSVMAEPVFLPLEETSAGTIAYSNRETLLRTLKSSSACLIGCGLGRNEETDRLIYELIKSADCPVILDADGINAIANNIDIIQSAGEKLILTPHPGEMSRLTGLGVADIQKNRLEIAREFAARYGITLVLKGAATVVASAGGKLLINSSGNVGLAKGGSGDLLAGMIAGFAAQRIVPEEAAACGVYLHGKAADEWVKTRSEYSLLPSDLPEMIPLLLKQYGR